MRYLITGTSRGIGLEFVRQLLARSPQTHDTVDALARNPDQSPALHELRRAFPDALRVFACDVAEAASVAAAVRALGETAAVDVLINNAGIILGQTQSLANLDFADMARTIEVDAIAPLRLTQALLPALYRGQGRRIVHISSLLGSLAGNTTGGIYGYRMAKAALNMASRSLAVELRADGFISVALNPGWVRTEMGGPDAVVDVDQSVRGMIGVLDGLTPAHSGRFLDFTGAECSW